ncbi:MAG: hypothetical protein QOI49_1277 [Verrucomicrobiota bacterium]
MRRNTGMLLVRPVDMLSAAMIQWNSIPLAAETESLCSGLASNRRKKESA